MWFPSAYQLNIGCQIIFLNYFTWCLIQVGNGIEMEAVGLQFKPYLWCPCGVTWDSSQTVVVIKLLQTSTLLLRLRRELNCREGGWLNRGSLRQTTTPFYYRDKLFSSKVAKLNSASNRQMSSTPSALAAEEKLSAGFAFVRPCCFNIHGFFELKSVTVTSTELLCVKSNTYP